MSSKPFKGHTNNKLQFNLTQEYKSKNLNNIQYEQVIFIPKM